MAKVRIYDIAKELSVTPKEILDLLAGIGVMNKVASSAVEETAASSLRQIINNRNNPQPEEEPVPEKVDPKSVAPAAFQKFRPGDFRGRAAHEEEKAPEAAPAAPAPPRATPAPAAAPAAPVAGAPAPAKPPVAEKKPAPAASAPAAKAAPAKAAPAKAAPAPATPPAPAAPAPPAPKPSLSPAPAAVTAAAARPGMARPGVPAAPPVSDNSPFATGGRDRRNMKRGRFHGRDRQTGPRFGDRDFRVEEQEHGPLSAEDKRITLSGPVTVAELAHRLRLVPADLIKKLFMMSIMRSANQVIEADIASQLAAQYGFVIEVEKPRAEAEAEVEEEGTLIPVPPVVVVMGHVDHGKTSLLDSIRRANVQRGEAGGITQRIGAYETEHNGERIVFLDTPGHEAFTRMRARGAHITDIAVLVVAADDGVMPQTREAIDHARAAKLPIIVAMNKMDKPGADPDRIKGQLAECELIPEDYGGDVVVLPVSAKTGQGVQELLDMILLVAGILELKANPEGDATGTVIEAKQDPNLGPVATVLLHKGTLHVGDYIYIGDVHGRVRAMLDYNGDNLTEAGPKTPVFLTGLSGVPHTSDTMKVAPTSRAAREAAEEFGQSMREGRQIGTGRSLHDMMARLQDGGVKELNIIIKADGQGSVEAIVQSLENLAHEEVRVRIISRGVGKVTESDVMLASASEAFIIAFGVGLESAARGLSDREKVEVRSYDVIYDAINDVKAAVEGMLKPIFVEKYMGEAEVRELFKSTKAGTIAGCYVKEGKIIQGGILRVMRNKKQIYEGKVDTLRHYKEEVKEMVGSQECGIATKGFNDFQVGDIINCYIKEQVKRSIDS